MFTTETSRRHRIVPNLVITSVFIQQRDDGLDVILLDYVQHLWTFNQNTVQNLQDSWETRTLGWFLKKKKLKKIE